MIARRKEPTLASSVPIRTGGSLMGDLRHSVVLFVDVVVVVVGNKGNGGADLRA